MIALAALLVLVAVALLVGGLGNGDTTLLWAAVGVSVLAAAVLVVQTLQRKRAGVTADGGPAAEGSVAAAAALQATAPPADEPTVDGPTTPETPPAPAGSHAARPVGAGGPAVGADGGPPEEEVEVTDLLIVLDLTDEVVVLDEHPRYHLTGCSQTAGQVEIPLPLDEAREDGFTACGVCRPDSHLADRERARRAATG